MHGAEILRFLVELAVILLAAKIFGALTERLGQPRVLGELTAGLAIGAGLSALFNPHDPALAIVSEIGVVLLLFETGLHCNLDRLLKAGPTSAAVAVTGVIAPFALGWGLMPALGHGGLEAVFVGAALTATSVGITARVLSDMAKLDRPESQIILGAAVIDDILGIAILSALQFNAAGSTPQWGALAGMALLPASFLIGVLLARAGKKAHVYERLQPAAAVFVPVFFVMVGAKVQLGAFNPLVPENRPILGLAALLIIAAVIGKLLSSLAVRQKGLNRWSVGVGMIPRGEVGLIFAQIGLSSGVIDPVLYAAVVIMVIATTFLAPPLLKKSLG